MIDYIPAFHFLILFDSPTFPWVRSASRILLDMGTVQVSWNAPVFTLLVCSCYLCPASLPGQCWGLQCPAHRRTWAAGRGKTASWCHDMSQGQSYEWGELLSPGHPHPVPGDAATLLGAPQPAALCLGPLNIARREHLLLHIVFVFILVSLLYPALMSKMTSLSH